MGSRGSAPSLLRLSQFQPRDILCPVSPGPLTHSHRRLNKPEERIDRRLTDRRRSDDCGIDTIGGTGLDTVGEEPLPENSPLCDFPNTMITPHAAALTGRVGAEVGNFMIENIRRFADGQPLLGIVHRHEGY